MFKYKLEKNVPRKVYLHWFLLSFLAGNVNAGGFLACERFVTHVTGFATLFGVSVSQGDWSSALGLLSVPFFFLLGAMISALLVDRPIFFKRKPHYGMVMGLVGLCLATAAFCGYLDLFAKYGQHVKMHEDYFFIILLCAASGLQNAAISTASASTVRTTHLTGLTTDLGIGIVRSYFLKGRKEEYRAEIVVLKLRLGSLFSFILGSVTGAALFLKAQYLGFLVPSAIAFYVMIVASKLSSYIPDNQIESKS